MKNLIVAIAFAVLSLSLPLTMAQQVVDVEPITQTESGSETRIENDGKRIVIDIKTSEIGEAGEDLKKAIETITEIFGGNIGSELQSEIRNLDDDDRNELSKELRRIFRSDNSVFSSDSGGISFYEFLIPLFGIIFTFGMPVIILSLILVYRNKKINQ